jgi:hypothetical protein
MGKLCNCYSKVYINLVVCFSEFEGYRGCMAVI